jgi:hypothetical protein
MVSAEIYSEINPKNILNGLYSFIDCWRDNFLPGWQQLQFLTAGHCPSIHTL